MLSDFNAELSRLAPSAISFDWIATDKASMLSL
jgi:hypothetical protein